jgi:GxxExxY protein
VNVVARRLIEAAVEVHRYLGPGYAESVYENALAVELGLRGIPFERQAGFRVDYKRRQVGEGRIDLLVEGVLVVELKLSIISPRSTSRRLSPTCRRRATRSRCSSTSTSQF